MRKAVIVLLGLAMLAGCDGGVKKDEAVPGAADTTATAISPDSVVTP